MEEKSEKPGRKPRYVIHPNNIAPGLNWLTLLWLVALTLHAFDAPTDAYWLLAGLGVIRLGVWIRRLYRVELVDLFAEEE